MLPFFIMPYLDFPDLCALARASQAVSRPCSCNQVPMTAWQALPMTLQLDHFDVAGTLVEDPYEEPSFAEYHPDGTRYDSADAPIAPRYYPYNLSQVLRCRDCGRHYLRYNEAGGYFTELRIRALQPALLVDAPL